MIKMLKLAKRYLVEFLKSKNKYPELPILKSFRWFKEWRKFNEFESTPLEGSLPWISFPAIDYITDYLQEKSQYEEVKIFEYGTGGSTIFFLNYADILISVEHDPEWALKVSNFILDKSKSTWTLRVIEPKDEHLNTAIQPAPSNPELFHSDDERYRGLSFREYVESIHAYPDQYFDIILIDGRARPSCFFASWNKIKHGGLIAWDNTDRDYYQPAFKQAPSELRLMDLPGPAPFLNTFTKTSIWVRN